MLIVSFKQLRFERKKILPHPPPSLTIIFLHQIDQPDGANTPCDQASSFCGLRDKKYPDKRAMGFPFDRPSATATSIEDFILPNMALVDFTIRLQNVTEPNPRNSQN